MGKKFPTKCKRCDENILMIQDKENRWKPWDYPDHSISGNWEKHFCIR